MKFDLIISNPPYNKGLDLKILESVLDLSDDICFVHPTGWLMRNRYKDIKKRLKSVDIYDGHNIFNIYNNFPVGITHFNGFNNIFKVNDYSHWFSIKDECYENDVNVKLKPYSWYSEIRQIEEKLNVISFKDKFHSIDKGKGFGVPLIRGHLKTPDFCTLVQKKFEPHWNKEYRLGYYFDNEKIARNCYNFLKSKFARFCISITKLDFHITLNIPWFDFSRSWSDEECAKELGITNEELLWMIQQIPDYYPEDAKTYRKLEEKLK